MYLSFSSLVDYFTENMGQDASLAQDKTSILLTVSSSFLAKCRRSCQDGIYYLHYTAVFMMVLEC